MPPISWNEASGLYLSLFIITVCIWFMIIFEMSLPKQPGGRISLTLVDFTLHCGYSAIVRQDSVKFPVASVLGDKRRLERHLSVSTLRPRLTNSPIGMSLCWTGLKYLATPHLPVTDFQPKVGWKLECVHGQFIILTLSIYIHSLYFRLISYKVY